MSVLNDYIQCPNCGKPNEKENRFCEFCGTKLEGIISESGEDDKKKKNKKTIIGILASVLLIGSIVTGLILSNKTDDGFAGEDTYEEMVAADFLEMTPDEVIDILGEPYDRTGIGGAPGFHYDDPSMVINFRGLEDDDLSFMVFPGGIPVYEGIPSILTYPELREIAEEKKIHLEDPVFHEGIPGDLIEEDVITVFFNYDGYRFLFAWYDADPESETCSECYVTDDLEMNYY